MNIPRSSQMEGEHTPTIIRLIRSTDLAIIQLEDSPLYSSIPTRLTSHDMCVSPVCLEMIFAIETLLH